MRRVRPTRRGARRGVTTAACGATLLAALTIGTGLTAGSATAVPSGPAASGPGARQEAFAAAGVEFGVPSTVLEAVSYAQTRWEGHAGQHSTDDGYGPMNLVDGTLFAVDQAEARDGTDGSTPGAVPASLDTLGQAATLLGVDRQALRTDPTANIRGGAALLAAKQAAR